jgi:regulator of sigma E protease
MLSTIGTNFLGFILVLGVLIFAHEAGHFIVAKLFGVRVLVFSFGFGKRLLGFKRGDTDYRVSLIPLGGYVRMAGDTPEESEAGDPDEFLARPKWQRFLILLAGPLMNLVIAIVFVAGVSMVGTEYVVVTPLIGEVTPNQPAARAGLRAGDRIVRVDGEKIEGWDDLKFAISMHAGTPLRVEYDRGGQQLVTTLTPEKQSTEYGTIGRAGVKPFIDSTVGRVRPGSAAARAGLRAGDRIVAANGKPVAQLADFETALDASKGAPLPLSVARAGSTLNTILGSVNQTQDPYRGFIPRTEIRKLSLIPALRESFAQNWKMLKYAGSTLARLFRAEGSVKELSGPISIARISGDMLRRGWIEVISLMAMISLQLGIMNLLPVPVLDGGHIFILLIEGAVRRDLSLRVKERIQQVGFAALAALMLVVIYNDVIMNVMLMRKG